MGKASRRKKEKKALEALEAQDSPKNKKGRKGAKVSKKTAAKAKKVTIEALDKKAKAVESALSSVVQKAQEIREKKNGKLKKSKNTEAKQTKKPEQKTEQQPKLEFTEEEIGNIQQHLNKVTETFSGEKWQNLKKEAKTILVKGGYYTVGIIAVVAIIMVQELGSNGRTYPGTKAAGVDIGYMPLDLAWEKLSKESRSYLEQPIIFSFEGDTFEVSNSELGIAISIDQTMEKIPMYKFEDENPLHFIATLFIDHDIQPVFTYDEDRVLRALEKEMNISHRKPRNARFAWTDNGLQIEPEASGFAVNRGQLFMNLNENINSLSTSTVAVKIEPREPTITVADLEQERDRLIGLLEQPLQLQSERDSLSIKLIDHLDAVSFNDPATIAALQKEYNAQTMLTVALPSAHAQETETSERPVELDTKVLIQLDKEKLKQYLTENLISKIEQPVSPAKIYTNEEGQVMIEGKGEDGLKVPYENLIQAITEAANRGETTVNVPVEVAKAPLDISEDLQKLGIQDLLTTGHSAYYGSSGNRMFNIEFGSAKYNGMLIAPGEEFSFNQHLGEVDAASGFVPEKVIKGDELKYEYGGGICQVSTTLYRAALQAGLHITERKPHSWKVSYYAQSMGDGMDATIYPGVTDLKFINNTPGHILIQAYTEDAEAYFKIYGTDDGRQVELDGPYGGGLTWRWNRTVLDKNGKPMSSIETLDENGTEEIWSRYVPIPPPKPATPPPAPDPTPASIPESSI